MPHQIGCVEPLMYHLVPSLVREMGDAYPELVRAQPLITETLKLEETKFKRTLDNGLKLLGESSADLEEGRRLSRRRRVQALRHLRFSARPDRRRAEAARHHRRYRRVRRRDEEAEGGCESCLERFRRSGDRRTLWFEIKDKTGASEFLGYDTETAEGIVAALVANGKEVEALKAGDEGALVFNQTPFYGESGGQVGDTGRRQRTERARFSA